MKCDTFRQAVEALDLDATVATFSPSSVLRSPVRDQPLTCRQAVGGLSAILFRVFEDLRFVGTYTSSDGAKALHLLWRLGDKEGEGVDVMSFDEDGLIEDYRVMVRPLSAVVALRDAAFSQRPKRPRRHCRIPNKVLGDQPVPTAWMPMHNPILCGESTPQEDPRPAVVDASAGVDVTFTEIGPVELKGISGVRLHAAHRAKAH